MRLIDADALINELNNSHYPGAPYVDAGISIAIGKVCDAPTIEPERKKGKWIPVTRIYKVTEGQFPNTHIEWVDTTDPDKIDAVRCSECREVFDFQDARNWCTECGADMREPEDIPMEYFESGGR